MAAGTLPLLYLTMINLHFIKTLSSSVSLHRVAVLSLERTPSTKEATARMPSQEAACASELSAGPRGLGLTHRCTQEALTPGREMLWGEILF